MKTAIIYARVSSKRQADDGVSMEAQIEQCASRAAQLGAEVVRVFRDDGISGRTVQARPAFRAAMDFCRARGAHYFIAWSTSRFARNAIDLWVQEAELQQAGTRLVCLNADIDDETDAGFINKVFLGAMDQMVSRQISRDTLRSLKQSASDGYFTGGRVPFGYLAVPEGKRTRLQVHPEESVIVQRAFNLFLQDGLGMQAIAMRLNEIGLLRQGKRWQKNTVNYMLKNTVYMGVKTFNRTSRKTRRAKPAEEWIQIESHPPLVAREDFERAQKMMDMRTPHEHTGSARSVFVFTGLLRCGVCNGKLQITNGTSRTGTLYSYYSCVGHRKGAPRCLFRSERADVMDDWLMGEILARVLTVEVMVHAMEDIATHGAEWLREREARRAQLVRDIRSLEGRRDNLLSVLEEQGNAAADLQGLLQRMRERNEELLDLQRQLVEVEHETPPSKLPRIDPAVAVEVMREVVQAADQKAKRAFLGAFLEGITITKGQAIVEYRPDALVKVGHEPSVRSDCRWLPVPGLLRTNTVVLPRQRRHSGRRTGLKTAYLSAAGAFR